MKFLKYLFVGMIIVGVAGVLVSFAATGFSVKETWAGITNGLSDKPYVKAVDDLIGE